jgi:hypothetical protein
MILNKSSVERGMFHGQIYQVRSIPDYWLSFLDLNAWQLNFYEPLVMALYCGMP